MHFGLTRLHCCQRFANVTRWLDAHWRAAKVLCLDIQGHPANVEWEASQPAPASSAGCARVLRVTCNVPHGEWDGWWVRAGEELPAGLPRWVAGVLPLCQNLTALHLRRVDIKGLPALPLLVHLILEDCKVGPVLVASLQGLTGLETLRVSGVWGPEPPVWDVRACTRLRRVFMGLQLAGGLAAAGQDLCLPPACTVALEFFQSQSEYLRGWLVRLGSRVGDLRLQGRPEVVATRTSLMHAPQLSQLRHLTLVVIRGMPRSLCVARLLGGLPRSVESLHLDYPTLSSEQTVVAVPASLRALRVKSVCDRSVCRQACRCAPALRTQNLTFGLHAGLERLCLVLWGVRVGLQCLDAGAAAGLRELNVQARVVDMEFHLAAEVAQRGRMLGRCDVLDQEWSQATGRVVPPVQVVFIGRGPVHMEYRHALRRERHWPCTCGSCAECLGPEAFGGVVDAWRV